MCVLVSVWSIIAWVYVYLVVGSLASGCSEFAGSGNCQHCLALWAFFRILCIVVCVCLKSGFTDTSNYDEEV